MARQHKNWPVHPSGRALRSIAAATVGGLALVILLGKLDGPSALLSNVMCAAARQVLGLLPSIISAVWQILQACAFDDQGPSACPLEMLLSFLPLLCVVADAA